MIAAVLLAHLVGDYLFQSHWMATEKINRWFPAIIHGVTYTLPFLFITQESISLLIICITHIIIDRYRLAKYIVWLKNKIGPKRYWELPVTPTGFSDDVPVWLATWLMILTDNVIHILINIGAILIFG